jgi:hypothetical protein
VLRALRLLSDIHGGDLLTAIIGQAIIAANTAHLVDGRKAEPPRFAGRAELPPDELRRPVSVLALAESLGLPFETTRRHVNKLIAAGLCKRVKGGVILLASAIDSPRNLEATEQNLDYVMSFGRALRRLGLNFD